MQDEQPAPAGVEKIIIEDVKKPAPADSTPDPSVFSEAWGILKISLAVFVAVSAYVMMKITDR